MICNELKEYTAPLHREAERLNYVGEIMSHSLSLAQYLDLLWRNYWLNYYVEQQIKELNADSLYPELTLPERSKCHLAKQDLDLLNIVAEVPTISFPKLSPAELLGAIYVVEGSTLGGSMICRKLSAGPVATAPKAFYNGYGGNTGIMWKSCVAFLNKYGEQHPDLHEEIIKGATKTYEYLLAISQTVSN